MGFIPLSTISAICIRFCSTMGGHWGRVWSGGGVCNKWEEKDGPLKVKSTKVLLTYTEPLYSGWVIFLILVDYIQLIVWVHLDHRNCTGTNEWAVGVIYNTVTCLHFVWLLCCFTWVIINKNHLGSSFFSFWLLLLVLSWWAVMYLEHL